MAGNYEKSFMNHSTVFRYFRRGDCPICAGARKDCRQSTANNLVFCRAGGTAPKGWGFVGEDRNGFYMWAAGDRQQQAPAKPAPTPTPTAEPLPLEDRDRHWRRIIRASGLGSQYRAQLLQRPHVTPAEVAALADRLFSWQGGQHFYLPPNFPGADGKGQLRRYPDNWAIAIPDIEGRLIGAQIKSAEGGYTWASSASTGGAGPQIDGELPLGIYGDRTPGGVVYFAEGFLKPELAALRYGGAWIGAAGGNWAGCPQQLKAALDALRPQRVVLCPDGGAIFNRHVLRAYRALRQLLADWGYSLQVQWWGQATKAAGDVDEIGSDIFHQAQRLPWAEFEAQLTASAGSTPAPGPTKAPDPKQARRLQVAQQAMGILNAALPTADTATAGGYMPPLPPIGAGYGGYAIDAPMGAGKTTRIGVDIVAANRAAGGFTLELSPRNSLGQQAAEAHGLPHIHHYGTDRESDLLLGVDSRDRGGLVLCPNSLERAAQHIPKNRPLHIVIDEAMATLTEALEGGTLKKKWAKVMELLIALLQRAATITISEANLDAATVALVEALSGKRLKVIHHRRNAAPWPVSLHAGGSPNGWRAEVAGRVLAGDRVWLTATSVDELRRWELWAKDQGIGTLLICGETNDAGRFDDLFTSPDNYLSQHKPQLFLTNQSVQTGLSVKGDHFDLVAGYGPGFPAEVLYQQLGRYRRPVPRLLWVPDFIPPNRWEKPQRGSVLAEMGREVAAWAGKGFHSKDPHQAAIDGYLAARWQGRWAQKMVPGAAMARLLGRAGHSVNVSRGVENITFQHQWQELTEALARQRSEFHAGLALDECHDLDWAHRTLEGSESTHEDRCRGRKRLTAARFPGVDWDSADIWYAAIFCPSADPTKNRPSRGPLAPGAALWAECDRLLDLHQQDQAKALEILAGRLRAAHMLPTAHKRVALLAPFRPLVERLLRRGMADPQEADVKAIARAARRAGDDLTRHLRITATADQSDIAIACKIIRKFGLAVARSKLRRVGKAREWSYTVDAPALWGELVVARERSLDAVTNLHKELFNKSVTTPSPGTLVRSLKTGTISLVEAVEGAIATLGDEQGRNFQAPLATLTPLA